MKRRYDESLVAKLQALQKEVEYEGLPIWMKPIPEGGEDGDIDPRLYKSMLYSTTTFGAKVGGGVAMAVAMAILGAAGYDGLAAVQPAAAMDVIKTLYLYVPIPFLVIIPILYLFYKLDKIYPQVMADLSARSEK